MNQEWLPFKPKNDLLVFRFKSSSNSQTSSTSASKKEPHALDEITWWEFLIGGLLFVPFFFVLYVMAEWSKSIHG
jgi:hypothetical protein